jgi:succinyl-diaminopimelate desuccinylase
MGEIDVEGLLGQIDEAELVGLLGELIRFKSVNPPGNEREIAEYVGQTLSEAGLEVEVVPHGPDRASVVAWLKGSGEVPGLLYTGHLDVVPLGDDEWLHDPFGGEVFDGKVWGRGASDMKAGDAAMMTVAKILAAAKVPLKGDLILAFTAGEETDFLGSRAIADQWHWGPVQAVFVSEPTDNDVIVAERGMIWLEITTYGKTAHISQLEQGRNALMMMLPILTELDKLSIEYEEHPLLGHFARSNNTIHAGTKTNTIPDRCVATVDMRTVPGQDHDAIVAQIEEFVAGVGERHSIRDFRASAKVIHDKPPLATEPQDEVVQRFLDIVGEVTGNRSAPKGAGYGTDAAAFVPKLESPFVICGPGNPLLNHQTNEWADIAKLVDSTKIYLLTAGQFLG